MTDREAQSVLNGVLVRDALKIAIDALGERIKRVDGWVKTTDDIPINGSDVLAFQDNGEEARIVPANYDKGVWYDCVFNVEADNITHWQPLPNPPKEAENGTD